VTAERHREHYNGPVRSAYAVLILAKVVDDCAWAAATSASTMATRSEAGALSYGGRSGRLGDADKKGDGRNLDPEVGDGAADVDKLRQGRRRQWRRSRQGGSSDADLNVDGALLRVRGVRRPVSSVRPAPLMRWPTEPTLPATPQGRYARSTLLSGGRDAARLRQENQVRE
jgi:hypothetical protein